MRKLLGLLLAVIGAVFGRAAYENAPTHREDQLAAVTRILTNPGVDTAPLQVPAAKPALTNPPPATPPGQVKTASAEQLPRSSATVPMTQAAVTAPTATTTTAWQTSVSAGSALPATTAAVTSVAPGDGSARFELVRALQTELKRVGCYNGDADGNWGSGSKRAMVSFMDRVNATLPVEQPDYIQLTLLQGQNASVCGRDCPKGQVQIDDGRCMPSAILARVETKKAVDGAGRDWTAQTTVQPAPPVTSRNGGAKAVENAATEQLPWANKPVAAHNSASAPVTPREHYATASVPEPTRQPSAVGRMSIGGPVSADLPAASAPVITDRATGQVARLVPPVAPGTTGDAPSPTADGDENAQGERSASPETPLVFKEVAPGNALSKTNRRAAQQFAAVSAAPPNLAAPRAVVQPGVRANVPRYYAPRPQRAAARPQRPRVSSNYRPQRSVQSLFTHPLGRL